MKKYVSILFAALAASVAFANTSTPVGFTDDFDAAAARAEANGRKIVAVFSGSDWCGWCKKFEEGILSKDGFLKAATNAYELVYIDNPMDEGVLSETGRKNNRRLTREYEVKGFPTVLVMDATGKVLATVDQPGKSTPEEYLDMIGRAIREAPDVEKYIKPIEAVLNRYDDKMEEDSRAALEKVKEKFPKPEEELSKPERRKFEREMRKYARQVMFEEVYAKYVPLYEKAFAEAKGMAVPEHMEARKEELIGRQEASFDMLRQALKMYEEAKKNGTLDKEDEEDDDDDDDDEALPRRLRQRPVFVAPKPEDAHTDAEYFANVAVPFWRKHIVETFHAPEGMDEKTAARVLKVREALVRKLATARLEFPTGAECREANNLWNGAKCRDAAVGIVRYLGMSKEKQYWQGGKMFKEMIDRHDDASEPMLGYLLRWGHANWAGRRLGMSDREKKSKYQPLFDERTAAFDRIAPVFKEADCRILERLDSISCADPKAGEKIGDRYLALLQAGGETNLLEAVKARPDSTVAMMALAKRYGFECGGDGVTWFNRAVSNSLDGATSHLSQTLYGQTTRWGGSTEFLYSVVSNAANNVRTDSVFSYHAAARALHTIYKWEVEHVPTDTNICAYVIGPDLRKSLFRMFDAYIAAGEQPLMPSVDVFRGMAMALAMQLDDWETVRRYASQIKSSISDWHDAVWLRLAAPNGEYVTQINMFLSIGDKRTREDTIRLGEALSKGDMQAVLESSEKMLKTPKIHEEASVVASRSYYRARKALQEAAGGWVDAMPTAKGTEAVHWWGMTGTADDGRARIYKDGPRGYYRIQVPLPGLGYEYEGTVHFEEKDPEQKHWNIGWGWSHPYVGNCMDDNSWAYPYIRFWRDESGDHYHIESFTRENLKESEDDEKGKRYDESLVQKASDEGWSPKFVVKRGDLERKDSHSFRLVADKDRMTISIDGGEAYSVKMDDLMGIDLYQERVRPDGTIYPIWKLFKNTAFSGYRYRRVPAEGK